MKKLSFIIAALLIPGGSIVLLGVFMYSQYKENMKRKVK